MEIRRFLGEITAKFHKTHNSKGDALRRGVPRMISENPNTRARGWKLVKEKFGARKANQIYNEVNKSKLK